jgi:hypothetical protein
LTGALPSLFLLEPQAQDLGPVGGELDVDRGDHRLRGSGVDGLGDAGVNPAAHRGVRVSGIEGVGGDQHGGDQRCDRFCQRWGVAGLVQTPPQIGPVPVEDGRVPVGLFNSAQGL